MDFNGFANNTWLLFVFGPKHPGIITPSPAEFLPKKCLKIVPAFIFIRARCYLLFTLDIPLTLCLICFRKALRFFKLTFCLSFWQKPIVFQWTFAFRELLF